MINKTNRSLRHPLQRFVLQFSLVLLTIGIPGSTHALSSITQLSRKNINSHSLISIQSEIKEAESIEFRVEFKAPPHFAETDSISGKIELRKDDDLIATVSVHGTRPATPSKALQANGTKDLPVVFTFLIKKEHLSQSKFRFTHNQPDSPRFDNYWFSLKEFAAR